mmetsp:Transcript_53025/g.141755  ORF Transcript_53025/g.141755 Transcript_53025/m.141755 type:complete len:285 (+) Transcript_53025:88-942(+)
MVCSHGFRSTSPHHICKQSKCSVFNDTTPLRDSHWRKAVSMKCHGRVCTLKPEQGVSRPQPLQAHITFGMRSMTTGTVIYKLRATNQTQLASIGQCVSHLLLCHMFDTTHVHIGQGERMLCELKRDDQRHNFDGTIHTREISCWISFRDTCILRSSQRHCHGLPTLHACQNHPCCGVECTTELQKLCATRAKAASPRAEYWDPVHDRRLVQVPHPICISQREKLFPCVDNGTLVGRDGVRTLPKRIRKEGCRRFPCLVVHINCLQHAPQATCRKPRYNVTDFLN